MKPWRYLNNYGKLIVVCCCINLYMAVTLALNGDWSCILSTIAAIVCGLATYSKKCIYHDASDINNNNE